MLFHRSNIVAQRAGAVGVEALRPCLRQHAAFSHACSLMNCRAGWSYASGQAAGDWVWCRRAAGMHLFDACDDLPLGVA
jgi:hypothetical protein